MEKKAYIAPSTTLPNIPVTFTDACIGCNTCVNVCRTDVLLPNPEKGKPPIVAFPDDCWYCGCCVADCPLGANRFHLPINQQVAWKNKETGKLYRVGMGYTDEGE